MRVRDVIKAEKTNVTVTPWSRGPIPPGEFKLYQHAKTTKLSPEWSWRVWRFDALGASFRVLLKLRERTDHLSMTLATDQGGVCGIVQIRELHPGEPGWHCHTFKTCDKAKASWTHREMRRYPRGWGTHPPRAPNRDGATTLALEFYRLDQPGALL